MGVEVVLSVLAQEVGVVEALEWEVVARLWAFSLPFGGRG